MLIENSVLDYELDTDSSLEFVEGGICLLLDGDPIAYSSAAACDHATHIIKLNGANIYHIDGGITDLYNALGFKNYRDFGEMLEKNPHIEYEKMVRSDDEGNMYHTIKAQIRKLIKRTNAGSIKVFLTDGDSNFRLTEEIATILKYKGNRSSETKPQMLAKARKYMIEELGCTLVTGMEADDALSIEHRKSWKQAMEAAMEFYSGDTTFIKENPDAVEKKAMELTTTVLATIDKDIKMCAGKFINPDQDLGIEEIFPMGHLFIEEKGTEKNPSKKLRFSGLRGFYAQLLLGDDCDNIPSVYFCGDTRVYEVLGNCTTEEELFKATLREIYEGFHRENIKNLAPEIESRLELAIASGKHGKDNKSNRAKVKKKIKDYLINQVAFGNKYYFHWSEYALKEDGTVSKELLNHKTAKVLSITPLEYMLQVAQLVYMLEIPPQEDGSHLWQVPNQKWADEVIAEYETENLLRIPMTGFKYEINT